MTKQRVSLSSDYVCIDKLLDGKTIEEVMQELQGLQDKYLTQQIAHDLEIRFHTDHYGYDGGVDLYLTINRWETDKEYYDRLDQEQTMAAAKAERARIKKEKADARAKKQLLQTEDDERAMYESLKAKYG